MNKKFYLILALALLVLASVVFMLMSTSLTIHDETNLQDYSLEDYRVWVEQDQKIVSVDSVEAGDNVIIVRLSAMQRGKAILRIENGDVFSRVIPLQVYYPKILVADGIFGRSRGYIAFSVAILIYFLAIFAGLLRAYRKSVRSNIYQYRNVMILGVAIFVLFLILNRIPDMFRLEALEDLLRNILSSGGTFSLLMLPVFFLTWIYIIFSNLYLMKKEGRNWHNMLGTILGAAIFLGTLFPELLSSWLQRTSLLDVHNERGVAMYVELFIENSVGIIVAYLESVLLATIWFGIKAARHKPAFDKDYVLILGCQINEDGSLTNLLKARTDKAVDFAAKQKAATGKEIVFVPSGGQGSDEVMPEAQAIRNYLLSIGIPEERILAEDQSVNTYENLNNSMKLIRRSTDQANPKVIFSTTNYHVFRAGLLATGMGLKIEGIGSRTRQYFWINAFVREYIATLYSERKIHIRIILLLLAAVLLLVALLFAAIRYGLVVGI